MDKIPSENPMENPPHPPLAGLDPADLLRQGAAAETLMEDASAFHPPSIEDLAPLFPQFEILRLIGQGGMGAVYQVRQRDLDRVVALKILPPAIGEATGFSERFAREAKALARLNHPGIVTIHEFGRTSCPPFSSPHFSPLYFILMEFVDGVNLAQLMQAGRIAPREALAIVPQICDALQYAHDQGIVHRDIKPENLLLDRLGRVKVADFGIAKIVGPGSPHVVPPSGGPEAQDPLKVELPAYTESGKIIGTPQYMAPEQIGQPSAVDHRADIYALGVVFYQMLTGELPGKDWQAPSRKVSIDVRLDEMVLRAMDANPERRYQTAQEFRTVVDEMQSSPLVAPLPKPGIFRRWCWLFLSLGLAACLTALWAPWYRMASSSPASLPAVSAKNEPPDQPPLIEPPPVEKAQSQKPATIEMLPDGTLKLDVETLSLLALTDELKEKVKNDPNASITIDGSGKVPYARVLEMVDLCQKIGIWNLSFGKGEDFKLVSVSGWLDRMDAEDYAGCYSQSAGVVKGTMAEDKWIAAMKMFRTPLGAMVSRKMSRSKEVRSLPGVPDGEHRVMQFDTEFVHKKTAVETVVFTKDNDGVWRCSGYFIR